MKLFFFISLLLIVSALISCQFIPEKYPEAGVSSALATQRSKLISKLDYHLVMDVPIEKDKSITAQSQIRFKLSSSEDIFLDFKADSLQLMQVVVNGDTLTPKIVNEHIQLPSSSLSEDNLVSIDFIMGDGPLNRNDQYFYSLFVPDRARTAIPCFDQPDLKGTFSVTITLPSNWKAVANGPQLISQELANNRKTIEFGKSKPISTYLWSYAAGEFEYASVTWKEKPIGLFHMVKDTAKFNHNIKTIFDQTLKSLEWLEDYSNYPYPYENYNLVAIPSFQFGGMEHPGSTYYRSDLIFLENNPTPDEELRRANLIAHETAHMWFGDLVTMPWFDEVWLKEVFANYMADKITQPWFPDINHQLRFLLAHFPSAYSVDRTEGANPINQKLHNLKNAGTLYGSIIYHKSPIVMAQLESMVGPDKMQEGIQEYIHTYAFGNASWDDLVNCIDKLTENDLKVWSNAWVNEPGRPLIVMQASGETTNEWHLSQKAEFEHLSSMGTFWPQEIEILNNLKPLKLNFYDATLIVNEDIKSPEMLFFSDDKGYGLFRMNNDQIGYWLNNTSSIDNALVRGRSTINLFENYLDGSIDPNTYINFLLNNIMHEEEALLVNLYGSQLRTIFWYGIAPDHWNTVSASIEEQIIAKIKQTNNQSIKKVLFRIWSDISVSNTALDTMESLCKPDAKFYGISINEQDQLDLVAQLAIKEHTNWEQVGNNVISNLKNDDLKAMLTFCLPALSNDVLKRDVFWKSLAEVENRSKEKWVERSLSYLHHPLRSSKAIKHLYETLDLLEEIQETGDIFFPIGWLDNSIGKYSSKEAVDTVNKFLMDHPDYPEHLKKKILQNIDLAKRSVMINESLKTNY